MRIQKKGKNRDQQHNSLQKEESEILKGACMNIRPLTFVIKILLLQISVSNK